MMISVVIKGPTFEDAYMQISQACPYADLVELRLDCFESLNLDALKLLRSQFSIPMIFTLRSQMQGGGYTSLPTGRCAIETEEVYTRSEEKRLAAIRDLVTLKPEYLDLEYHVSPCFIEEVSSQFPETKLILSYHNFSETPEDLDGLYREMQKIPAFFYKIAVAPKNCKDALRLVCWAKKSDNKLIAISMGSQGQFSRILGPVVGSPITYAALEEDQKSAPGQLPAKTLIERFHHHSLNPHTTLYGLIGDPVDQSISDETHNCLIRAWGFDAVYVKIPVGSEELSDFLQLAKLLPFHGLSVTMPLKENILPFLDEIDPQALEIGAVNTLLFEEGKIFGFNTDGIGALNAIEKEYRVKEKRIVIIGAGGAAKAIAYEAVRRGGLVTIINRDERKAEQIARSLHCIGKGLGYMAACSEAGYDILINCTPATLPISSDYILPQAIVMDIMTKPKETLLLTLAREKGCPIIYGYRMFVEQALGQFNLWFKDRLDIHESRKILEKKAIDVI
jgi:3-dehydroquinate dehydratase/shikimate dehydrogenase